MNIQQLDRVAGDVTEVMKVLSNRTRLLILCLLAKDERSVGQLAERLGVREPTVSQHLALMRRDGLLRTRRAGQTIYYRPARDDVVRLMEFLYATYCGDPAAC